MDQPGAHQRTQSRQPVWKDGVDGYRRKRILGIVQLLDQADAIHYYGRVTPAEYAYKCIEIFGISTFYNMVMDFRGK